MDPQDFTSCLQECSIVSQLVREFIEQNIIDG
jgi:hypothetical protein